MSVYSIMCCLPLREMWHYTLSGILESRRISFHRNKSKSSKLSFLAHSCSYSLGEKSSFAHFVTCLNCGWQTWWQYYEQSDLEQVSSKKNRTQVLAQGTWLICSGPKKCILLLLTETIQQPSLVVTWVTLFCYPTLFGRCYNYFKVGYHLILRIWIFMVQSLPFCI